MFTLFKLPEPNADKVDQFCTWFIANQDRFIESVEHREQDNHALHAMLDEVEAQLALVYRDGYKYDIQFEYGYNNNVGKWDFNLFHQNNRFLKAATKMIADRINEELGDKWSINTAR